MTTPLDHCDNQKWCNEYPAKYVICMAATILHAKSQSFSFVPQQTIKQTVLVVTDQTKLIFTKIHSIHLPKQLDIQLWDIFYVNSVEGGVIR